MTNEVMTEQEALSRIELLTRERDAVTLRLCAEMHWPTPVEQAAIEDYHIREFLQRPGYQNGMAKLEEMN